MKFKLHAATSEDGRKCGQKMSEQQTLRALLHYATDCIQLIFSLHETSYRVVKTGSKDVYKRQGVNIK